MAREDAALGLTLAGPRAGPQAGVDTPVDAHGVEVSRAILPGGSMTVCHDETANELFTICEEAGLETRREPRDIFTHALPVGVAARAAAEADVRGDRTGQAEGRHAVIPDAAIRVSMPRALDSAAAAVRPHTARLPMRRLLFDVKTVHAGTSHYRSARARRQRGGAVQARAQDVEAAYRRHAQRLDRIHHPPGTPRHRHPVGPIEQVVLRHSRVRGLVFGAYGEWSSDVEWLLEEAARAAARRDWRRGVTGGAWDARRSPSLTPASSRLTAGAWAWSPCVRWRVTASASPRTSG